MSKFLVVEFDPDNSPDSYPGSHYYHQFDSESDFLDFVEELKKDGAYFETYSLRPVHIEEKEATVSSLGQDSVKVRTIY